MFGHYRSTSAFTPLMASLSGAALTEQNRLNVARLRRAAYDDDWDPYLDGLRARGIGYAQQGVSFIDWSEVFQLAQLSLLDLWTKELGEDRESIRLVTKGVVAFFDTIVQTVGDTYFRAHELKLRAEQETVRELSTPVLQLGERLLLAPLIGEVSDQRMRQLEQRVLYGVREHNARGVILDLSGVIDVDTAVAGRLQRCAEAVRLLGAKVWLSGLSVEVCEAMVTLGIELPGIEITTTLDGAIAAARGR